MRINDQELFDDDSKNSIAERRTVGQNTKKVLHIEPVGGDVIEIERKATGEGHTQAADGVGAQLQNHL